MRKISLWAKQHRFQAIGCIVLIKIMLAAIAFYLGSALADLNIYVPSTVFTVTMLIFLMSALLYPSRRRHIGASKKQFYIWQKSCDFAIAACSFVMIGTLVNSSGPIPGIAVSLASNVAKTTTPTAEEILASLKYRDKNTLTRQEKRILQEEFKKQIKTYTVAKITGNKDGAGKAALIALTIIGALGLLYVVAALSCALACNGAEAAAVIVAILGAAAVIWGGVALMRRISRGPKRKKTSETNNKISYFKNKPI